MEPDASLDEIRPDRSDPFRPVSLAPKPEPDPPKPRRRHRMQALATGLVAAALSLPVAVLALWTVMPPISTPMMARRVVGEPVTRIWRPIETIDRRLVASVIASEDNGFCSHAGVDWDELREVVSTDGGPRRGASTITMQVAKNLFLWQGRSYVRKALEIPLALMLDLLWSKRRIMEAYLNIAEWGPTGEFGIEAGARRALHKGADRLSPSEAAMLTAMLPNPHTRDAARPTANLRRVAGIVRARAAGSPEFTDCIER